MRYSAYVSRPIAGICMLLGIVAMPALAAPDRVYVTTAESGGREGGCVSYSTERVASGKNYSLRFAFLNECGRDVWVKIGTQFGNSHGGWHPPRRLKAGESLAGPGKSGNWIGIDWLPGRQRFVIMQAELANRDGYPSLSGCAPRPDRRDPPCPPMIDIGR